MKTSTFLKTLAILSICFWVSGNIFAQNQISGRVLQQDTPLAYANILLLSAADSSLVKGDLTDEEGAYALDISTAGSYFIKVEMIGFDSQYSEPFNFKKADIRVPDLKLSEGLLLEEITVSAKKPLIELRADKMIVNVAGSSINSGQTALEILSKSPGIAVDNQNNISLKGKQGVLITIDGKNQYLSNEDLARILSTMPASSIENIEIITNPSAKYDAEGNAGIINIVLKRNENIGTNGQVSTTFRQGLKTYHFHN